MGNRICILVGFSYPGTPHSVSCRGIRNDLTRMESLVRRYGASKVTVIDDLNGSDESTSQARLGRALNEIQNRSDVLLYFSGHCRQDSILLGDGVLYPIQTLLERVRRRGATDLLALFDCCRFPRNILPFSVHETDSRVFPDHLDFDGCTVTCIASSSEDEDSSGTKHGSLFTTQLIDTIGKLEGKNLEAQSLLARINHQLDLQTAQAYSNVPWPCSAGPRERTRGRPQN